MAITVETKNMPIQKALPLFTDGTTQVTDFSSVPVADIFNDMVVPRLRSLASMLQGDVGGLDEAKQRRDAQRAASTTPAEIFAPQEEDPFASEVSPPDQFLTDMGDEEDYNQPVGDSGGTFDGIKLSNYGYATDKTPDYNSNVLRVGHSDNKLVSGRSAALTKSLAERFGIKPGDEFEAVDSNGKVYRRRYDDTVPSTYKGSPLPETVDLYDVSGNNSFAGRIVEIRPVNS